MSCVVLYVFKFTVSAYDIVQYMNEIPLRLYSWTRIINQ